MAILALVCLTMLTVVAARVAPLANCPVRCHCDDDTLIVSCSEGHLDVLPIALNPSIQRLEIKKNKIRIVDSSLQFYSELTYLDLSHNRLFGLPAKTFYYQKKLLELHLNHNQIGTLANKTFHGLAALTVLNLRSNELNTIGAGAFSALTSLQELNLGQNRISQIDVAAFEGLANLRVLYLDDNSLTTVPSVQFAAMPSLAELFLGINQLGSIQPGAFEALTSLNRLELQGVQLRNLSLATFRGLENVRHMDLTANRLQRIPTVELSTLVRLEELKLGQNEFQVIAEAAFVGMTNLRRLDVSGSLNLTRVEAGAFSANTNLESVVLASNKKLSAVHEGAFGGLPHLRHVVLRDNAITTLSEGMFPWAELTTFDLAENPIVCDCSVMWLRNVLLAQNGTQAAGEQILCAAPEHMHNEPLRLLSPELLGCAHLDGRRQAVVGLMLVAAAAFITAALLIGYKCRATLVHVLSGGKWTAAKALGHKEAADYTKSIAGDDYARFPHPCASLSVHPSLYNYPQMTFGAVPATGNDYQQQQQLQQGPAPPTRSESMLSQMTTPHKVPAVHHITDSMPMSHVFQLSQDHLMNGASNKAFSLFPHNFGSAQPAMQNAYTASPPHHHQQQQQQQQQQLSVSPAPPTESHYSSLQLEYDYAVAVHRNGHPQQQQHNHVHHQHQQQHHHHNTMAPKSAARPLGPAPALPARNGTVTLPKHVHGAKRTYH